MTTASLERPADAPAQERKIVTIRLGGELYGLDIDSVQRVLTRQPITPVPQMPPAVRGVMNLRGKILPVLDLRARFGMPPLPEDGQDKARFVIVEADGRGAALIADSVAEVCRLPESALEPPPALLASRATECIAGLARIPRNPVSLDRASVDRVSPDRVSPDRVSPGEAEEEAIVLLLDVRKTLDFIADDPL